MRKVIVVMVLLLGGCQSWSEVTGNRFSATMLYRRPAVIDQIDHDASFATNPIKVEPGEHRIILQGSAPGWPGGPPLQVYYLNAEPCKRYYINAQSERPRSAQSRSRQAQSDSVSQVAQVSRSIRNGRT